ncbi:hypothetical protein IK7_03893 [Bacillus cereus VD156]|uniref:Uncharacterized protein n=1 Tax=Bacillus cereus HuB4-4 TaxID=1053211 RepID=A0A9W5QWN5_BACCE|nr:hypothetical protein IK7_03893 [Bacillus cereus VD156]EOP91834.1 hypothetical protein IGM_01894 [Bacillus cereus HuB4-4]
MTKNKLLKTLYFNLNTLNWDPYFDSLHQPYFLKLTNSFFFVNRVGVN